MQNSSTYIHVALCADENFSLPLGVCITSMFENNKNNKIKLHILTFGFSTETLRRIEKTRNKYNQTIEVHKVDDNNFTNHPISSSFPKSIYLRYLLPYILDDSIDKIIYLDSDTIVLDDLTNLYNIDVSNNAIAAIPDANTDDIIERNRIGIYDGHYLNSGVLVVNLEYWRKHNTFYLLTDFILKFPEKCLWPDQDALNVVLHNRILWLPFKYNMQIVFTNTFKCYRMHSELQDKVVENYSEICILHYSSWDKPWFKQSNNQLTFVWRYFYKLSLWSGKNLKSRGFKFWLKQKIGIIKNERLILNPLFLPTLKALECRYR